MPTRAKQHVASRKHDPAEIPNIHPADELFEVRAEIAILQKRADELRDKLLQADASLKGDMHTAFITSQSRETLDKKALIEAFGEAAVAPYVKSSTYKVVKVVENTP